MVINMDIIKVSDKIFEQKPKYIGYESNIYEIDDILLKIFDTNDIEILKNKRNKLEILYSLDIDDIKPINLVEINGIIKGYSEKEKQGYHILDMFKESTSKKLEILKNIKQKLEILHKNNVIFGDISLNNILTDGKNICFCDLDNTKIGSFNFDVLNNCQRRYLHYLEADEYLDIYMLNLLTITYLKHIFQPNTLEYIKNYSLPFILNTKENRQIVENMIKLNHKEDIKPFIEHTKRYQLF